MQQAKAESMLSTIVKINRERRGWSQATVADLLRGHGMDVHATGIARLENGDRTIRVNEMFALIRVFDLDAAQLLPALAQLDASAAGPATIEDRIRTARQVSDAAHEMVTTVLGELESAIVLQPDPDKAREHREEWEYEQAELEGS